MYCAVLVRGYFISAVLYFSLQDCRPTIDATMTLFAITIGFRQIDGTRSHARRLDSSDRTCPGPGLHVADRVRGSWLRVECT